jgi:SAM-dependent methyltransferase
MKNDILKSDEYEWSVWYRYSEFDDKNYINFMHDCLSLVRNNTILELGPFLGWHTSIMVKLGAKKIICVEPNKKCIQEEVFQTNSVTVNLHSCTANDYYAYNNESVDMVVCCGLLHHLHSPIHLLEKIINISKPKYILIETTDNNDIDLNDEKFYLPGNAFTDTNITFPILKHMIMPTQTMIECIQTTNYRIEKINSCNGYWNNNSKPTIVSTILFKKI